MDHKAFIQYFNEKDAFAIHNNIKLVEYREGYSKAVMTFSPYHYNFMNTYHGGAIYTLADVVAGTAGISHGTLCVTLSATMNYIKNAGSSSLTAEAIEKQNGRTIRVYEINVTDENGNLVAIMTATIFNTGKPCEF